MQFLVPQFIDVEDKILGSLTTRQFIIMLAGLLLVFILYKMLAFMYFVAGAVVVFPLTVVLAFVKINGRPIHFFLLNFVQTFRRPKLRVWNKAAGAFWPQEEEAATATPVSTVKRAPVSSSRLSDLSLIVNTGGVYQSEEERDQFNNL